MSLWPGVGLVAANMIGAGVFLSAGFMAQDMGPGPLLWAWVVGAVLAVCGAVAYGEVARLVPRSGGEYRYLSELLHPSLGYLAGWGSLLLGFSAPVAVDALAAGAFARAAGLPWDPRLTAVGLVVALTVLHVVGLRSSAWTQNVLVVVKAALLLGFVGVGVFFGSATWPSWNAPGATAGAFPLEAFVGSLFYIAFAFSGWNAAAYASEEFEKPARDVPRAMLIGCALVATLYLVVNWIFVANLTPAEATAVFGYDKFVAGEGTSASVTLGQVIVAKLLGSTAGRVMAAVLVVLFVSAMSAMTFAGPRVYAAMARDGFLPRVLTGQTEKPPVGSVLLQGGLALVIVFTHDLKQALQNVGAILTLFAGLTVLGLFRVLLWPRPAQARPSPLALLAAAVYAGSAGYMLYFGFRRSTHLLWWIGAVVVVALLSYAITLAARRPARG